MRKIKLLLIVASIAIISGSSQLKSNTKQCDTPFPDPPTLGWTVSDFHNFNDYPPSIQPCMGGWIARLLEWLGMGPKGGGGGATPSFDWYNCWVANNVPGKACHGSPAGPGESLIADHACSTIQACAP